MARYYHIEGIEETPNFNPVPILHDGFARDTTGFKKQHFLLV